MKRLLLTTALTLTLSSLASATEIEGFTEPFRNIDIAAADAGIIDQIAVKEGQPVAAGELLSELNHDILEATLEIADRTRKSQGKLKSAQAELRLSSERLEKLKMLLERRHASQEEVDRTVVEQEVAEAQVLSVEEELLVRQLEYDRIAVQIALRKMHSPIDGVVTKIFKDVGEFVSPSDPVVMNVVQLDPLLAVFSIPDVAASQIAPAAEMNVLFGSERGILKGTVEYVSPVTDAQSGTVLVKVRVPNPQGLIRAGERCFISIDGVPSPEPAQVEVDKAPESKSALRNTFKVN